MVSEFKACPAACGRGLTSDVGADASNGFVALSKFVVANDMTASIKAAFRHRPHLVDGAAGWERVGADGTAPMPRMPSPWPAG